MAVVFGDQTLENFDRGTTLALETGDSGGGTSILFVGIGFAIFGIIFG